MALAKFYSRTEQSLGQVLRCPDREQLASKLNEIIVAVAFDDRALNHINTFPTLQMAVNLFSRLYPRIAIIYSGTTDRGNDFRRELARLASLINPDIEIEDSALHVNAALCIGRPQVSADALIYVKASSWNLEVSIGKPTTKINRNTYNPITAAAVACFGVSEVFNKMFADLLPKTERPDGYVLSLLSFKKALSTDKALPRISLDDLSLVGLGAVANATVWCLSRLPEIHGSLSIIDPESVELSNLQRYVLTDDGSVGADKVKLAERSFSGTGLRIKPFKMSFGDYARKHRRSCDFDIIAISVDNDKDRISAQAVLPRIILNAWTDELGRLGVSHHWFDSHNACLACMYIATSPRKSYTEQIADAIGFEPMRTAELVLKKATLSKELLQEIVSGKGYPMEILQQWQGRKLDEFYSEAACGGVLLQFGAEDKGHEALVPLAHQSALAGILLASEIVKTSLGLISKKSPVEAQLDIISQPKDYILFPREKTTNPKCICTDPDYLAVYKEKYDN